MHVRAQVHCRRCIPSLARPGTDFAGASCTYSAVAVLLVIAAEARPKCLGHASADAVGASPMTSAGAALLDAVVLAAGARPEDWRDAGADAVGIPQGSGASTGHRGLQDQQQSCACRVPGQLRGGQAAGGGPVGHACATRR